MTWHQQIFIAATFLVAVGIWLLLPRGTARGRWAGLLLASAGVGAWATALQPIAGWMPAAVFYLLAGVTVASAIATISLRNPVYCAIWFAMTLLATAGLFLYQGAQFLAMATVVVYAGAILVTFLFVLMLAQPEGKAYYDRVSWESLLSAVTGAVIVGVLGMTIFFSLGRGAAPMAAQAAGDRDANVLAANHVERLGAELWGRHLLAVEVAGTLLLVALVGAAAILAHSPEDAVGADGGSGEAFQGPAPVGEVSSGGTPCREQSHG